MLETIKHGATGDLVKVAQYMTGFADMNAANGTFDADFVAHVCGWQGNRGLTPDGVIGANTWSALAAAAPTCSTSKNRKSEYACAIQTLIGGIAVDGVFGPNTKRAVAAYQSAHGLSADGICGPKTWAALIGASGSGSSAKTINACKHYLQWDSRWKNIRYSTHTNSQTIGNSGCGPTSMAMIMATWIDEKITPVEMCALAYENGYRTYNDGTDWDFFEFVFKHYDRFDKFMTTGSVETLKAALAQGALAVCVMNSNDKCFWTSGGMRYGSRKTR